MIKSKLFTNLTVALSLSSIIVLGACGNDGDIVAPTPTPDDTYSQVDRFGIAAINTVFNHPPAFSKMSYNTAGPADDLQIYRDQFETVLGAVANADPAGTAAALLPDELPVNLGSSTSDFARLDGRKLEDDATDVVLFVAVGVPSLQSDNVDANDKPFLNAFPYLAEPHQ